MHEKPKPLNPAEICQILEGLDNRSAERAKIYAECARMERLDIKFSSIDHNGKKIHLNGR